MSEEKRGPEHMEFFECFYVLLEIDGYLVAGFKTYERYPLQGEGVLIELRRGMTAVDSLENWWRAGEPKDGALVCLDQDGETVIDRYAFAAGRMVPEREARDLDGEYSGFSGPYLDSGGVSIKWLRIIVQSIERVEG